MSSNTFTQKSSIVPQGFGQPLAPGTPLPKGVHNWQARFANQPLPTKKVYSIPATAPAPAPATGVLSDMPGGKRRRRKTTKKRKTKRMRKSRRHR